MVLSYGLDGSHKPMKTTRDIHRVIPPHPPNLEAYKSRGDYLGSLNNIKIIYFHLI